MSTPALFSVTDSAELNALLRVFIQAKFRPSIPDTDIPSSKYVVEMIDRVVEAQRRVAEASGNGSRVSNFDDWLKADSNPAILAAVRARLKECPSNVWENWSVEQRRKHVLDVLSPLRAESQLVDELLGEVRDV